MSTDVVFAYYPTFKRMGGFDDLNDRARAELVEEVQALLDKYEDRVHVRGVYSAAGFRPDTDLLFWWTAPVVDDLQSLLTELRRTRLGWRLELTYAFLGVTRPAEFNPDHLPAFLKGDEPKHYLSVYPFVRTAEWYLMDSDKRSAMLREHGQMGREFPDVLPNTTSGFGIGDWEWILAFEADKLERIVDCLRKLREAEARRYTQLDVPFVVGIKKSLADAVADLG